MSRFLESGGGAPRSCRRACITWLAACLVAVSVWAQADGQVEAEARRQAVLLGLPVAGTLAGGEVFRLARFVGLRPLYRATLSLDAADTVSTDEVWSGGGAGLALDGAGQTIGMWDGGSVRLTHQEHVGRVVNLDAADVSNHSTRVAGNMISVGVDPAAKGMASAATIPAAFDFDNDLSEMVARQALPDPIRQSNHSYAMLSGWVNNLFGDGLWVWMGDVQESTTEDGIFGRYGLQSAAWDQLAYDAPNYLMVKGAGNDRDDEGPGMVLHWHFDSTAGGNGFVQATDLHPTDGNGGSGYDSIAGGAGNAKNVLAIGGVEDILGGYTSPADVVVEEYSGWGPADDGRVKPDLVANAQDVLSSGAAADDAYTVGSGTSISAPNVTGSLALLQQHADNLFGRRFTAATMKALVVHTADEAGTALGPDYVFGWGLLNTESAAAVLSQHAATGGQLLEGTLGDGESLELFFPSDGSQPLRFTLVWTDPPGTAVSSGVDSGAPRLINDLDLRVEGPSGMPFLPWRLNRFAPAAAASTGDNTVDTVEQIDIGFPASGIYTLEVSHKGVLLGGEQAFSLIASGHRRGVFADGFESGDTAAWSTTVP